MCVYGKLKCSFYYFIFYLVGIEVSTSKRVVLDLVAMGILLLLCAYWYETLLRCIAYNLSLNFSFQLNNK